MFKSTSRKTITSSHINTYTQNVKDLAIFVCLKKTNSSTKEVINKLKNNNYPISSRKSSRTTLSACQSNTSASTSCSSPIFQKFKGYKADSIADAIL